jgi:hypothetical protein
METYSITATALLRLASLASQAPGADAAEVLGILQEVQATPSDPEPVELPHVGDGPAVQMLDVVKPAKPE